MPTNRAAWLMEKKAHPYIIDEAPMPTPSPNEVLVRVHSVAINPADWVVQQMGLVYTDFPIVPGCDMAGEIVELGSGVTGWKVGDRVAAFMTNGAFQNFCTAKAELLVKLPEHVEFKQGCVVPLAFATSAVNLFESDMLALDLPGLDGEVRSNGKLLFIWGGSSALGSCAIQQAKAAGYEVAVTASEHNFEYCRRLGATHVFDYRNPNVVEEVVTSLKGNDSVGVFCTINGKDVVGLSAKIADGLGGNKMVTIPLPPPAPIPDLDVIPDGVRIGQCYHSSLEDTKVTKELFRNWLPAALEKGIMLCKPDPEVVGEGLEKVQEAVDQLRNGVSAKKLVVQIA